YRDVARKWKGTGLLYLVLLLAICWAVQIIKVQFGITHFAGQEGTNLVKQIPDITISDGEVSTDVQTPYFIKDEKGDVVAIIDLTGQYTSLENTTAKMLLTRNHFLVASSRSETRDINLKNVRSFHMDQSRAQGWLKLVQGWFALVLYPFALVFSFIYRAVQALIYALFGMVFAKMLKVTLDYLTLLRLAIVAVTPAIILDTLHSVLSLHTPLWGPICFLIAMGYLVFAIKSNSAPEGATLEQQVSAPQQ
ncbi:MAG TPA: DUF1189 family protein, partial [Terriglobia bacterium]|nr:DUF1189 family protein [Terriglobia bacterium]